ncbi:MAG: hypothetical protein WC503_01080 [Candidatus Shapirobacteria bacterium]
MKNEEFYKESVDTCVEVRTEINEDLYRRGIYPAKKVGELVLGLEKKFYKLIHDMIYYEGGYPSENSPPRLNEFLDRFIVLVKWFGLLNREEEINSYLSESGITLADNNKKEDRKIFLGEKGPEELEEIMKNWNIIFDEPIEEFNTTKKLMEKLLDKTLGIQRIVCELADSIKVDTAKKVKEKCEIKPPYFIRTVNTKAKEVLAKKNGKRGKQIIDNIKDDAENYVDVVSIL